MAVGFNCNNYNKMRQALVSFVCGIYLTDLFIGTIGWSLNSQLIVFVLLDITLILLYKLRAVYAYALVTYLFCLVLGSTMLRVRYNEVRYGVSRQTHDIQGVVIEEPIAKKKTVAVKLRTDSGALVIVYLIPKYKLNIGDHISAHSNYGMSPTCTLDNKDSVYEEYHKYLFYQRFSATCYVGDSWEKADGKKRNSLYTKLHSLQQDMIKEYNKAGFTGDEGAVIEAMTTGSSNHVSKQLRRRFSSSGISHILALSGFHLSIIYMLLELFLFNSFMPLKWRLISRLITIVFIAAYVMIAGAPPSLVRAAIMCCAMIVSQMFRRKINSLDTLVFTAMAMLLWNPLLLFNVGFQLSFLSMLGLITMGSQLYNILTIKNPIVRKVTSSVSSTIICNAFTLPLVAYYFGTIPLLPIASNLLAGVLSMILLFLAALWWLFALCHSIQQLTGTLLMHTSALLTGMTNYITFVDWATIEWHPNKTGVALCYLLLITMYIFLRRFKILPT